MLARAEVDEVGCASGHVARAACLMLATRKGRWSLRIGR